MSAQYTVYTLDLATPRDRQLISGTSGQRISDVYVIQLDAPAQAHWGGGDLWNLEQGVPYEFCPSETDGIYITNPAGAGVLKLGVGMEQSTVQAF